MLCEWEIIAVQSGPTSYSCQKQRNTLARAKLHRTAERLPESFQHTDTVPMYRFLLVNSSNSNGNRIEKIKGIYETKKFVFMNVPIAYFWLEPVKCN